jgi:hypothetical protein
MWRVPQLQRVKRIHVSNQTVLAIAMLYSPPQYVQFATRNKETPPQYIRRVVNHIYVNVVSLFVRNAVIHVSMDSDRLITPAYMSKTYADEFCGFAGGALGANLDLERK